MAASDPAPSERIPAAPPLNRASAFELLLVGVGGAAGSLARYVSGLIVPGPAGTLIVNLLGAFLLGWLVEAVLRLTADAHSSAARAVRLRRWRLLLGTGALGGFTTYSLLAADVAESLITGRILEGIGYGLATVFGGALASLLGILIGRLLVRGGTPEVSR